MAAARDGAPAGNRGQGGREMFGAWVRFVYRFRWPVLLASLALVAGLA